MSIENIVNYGLEPDQARRIFNGLLSYRGYKDSVLMYPETFLKELMSESHDSQQLYLPLEIIELTPFLAGGKVFGDFLLFDIKFIRKQFKAYPIYIELEIPEDKLLGQGVFYTESNELLKYCKSIFINAEAGHEESSKKAINIINELSDLSTHSLLDIPAMSRKEASVSDLKKYRIFVDDIHSSSDGEVVWAKDVRDALERIVKKHPEAEKILSMYYKDSPFINKPGFTIKRLASVNKVAEAIHIPLKTSPNQLKILEFIKSGLERYPQEVNGWVVGGYVRDSLMGKESDDLDVALSSGATGLEFAEFLKQIGSTMNPDPTGKVYSTALDKTDTGSGDLQVAALDIFGEKIDFVNLRTEEYSETSRVPVQTVTDNPVEDAQRRDLTINSLYYNIKVGQIEDYIGGMNDFEPTSDGNFKPKILRTPADPKQTFMDDPLRMLRVLRFYSRYDGVQIDPSVIEAFQDPDVLNMYDKLAPERASKEVRKMMEGVQAVEASRILLETGLYRKVFQVDEGWHDISVDQQNPYHNFNLMEHTLAVMKNYNEIAKREGVEGDERALMLLATLLHDFGKMSPNIRKQKIDRKTGEPVRFDRGGEMVDRYTYLMHENEGADFAQNIMTQMGFSPEEKKFVSKVIEFHMQANNFSKSMKPKAMGKYLYQLGEDAQYGDIARHLGHHSAADTASKGDISPEEFNEILTLKNQEIQNLMDYRKQMGSMIHKPVINGNEIRVIVDSVAPELSSNKVMIDAKGYGKPVFYLKLIIDKLLQQQWSGQVQNAQQAEAFVRSQAKQILNLWRQKSQDPKLAALDKSVKKAQKKELKFAALDKAVKKAQHLGEDNAAIYTEGYESSHIGQMEQDYQYLNRSIKVDFNVGDTVKQRNRGLNFKQKQGKVEKIKNNIMRIKWEDGKTTNYSLNDSAKIFSELEKSV